MNQNIVDEALLLEGQVANVRQALAMSASARVDAEPDGLLLRHSPPPVARKLIAAK